MTNWTLTAKKRLGMVLSAETWLPTEMPEYAQGFMDRLGSLTTSSFVVLILSEIILAMNGPETWSTNGLMRFTAATHFWAAQGFLFFMMFYLSGSFFPELGVEDAGEPGSSAPSPSWWPSPPTSRAGSRWRNSR